MSKRLILILSLVLGIGLIASAAYAEVQSIKVSGDLETLALSRYGFNFGADTSAGTPKGDASALISIIRVRFDADLTDDVTTTIRLLNERVWGHLEEAGAGTNATNVGQSELDLDLAYVTLKEFLYSPLTLTVGRQNLRLGSGLIIGDPDTNQTCNATSGLAYTPVDAVALDGLRDLSARKSFDGVVGVLDYAPLVVTLGFVKEIEGSIDTSTLERDIYLVNAAYDFGTLDIIGDLNSELYYIVRDPRGDNTNNLGIRLVNSPMENLNLNAEYAYQTTRALVTGDPATSDLNDTAVLLGADYSFPDAMWSPTIGVDYTRLAENWNVMAEDQTPADIINSLFTNSNAEFFGITALAQPTDDISLRLRYVNMQFITPNQTINLWGGAGAPGYQYVMDATNKDAGDELDLHVTYDYTEDVQLGLKLGFFHPGDAFASQNRDDATQVIGSMKVTF